MNSGSVTTTNAEDLLFAAAASSASITAGARIHDPVHRVREPHAGPQRDRDRDLQLDRHPEQAAWVIQLVAFKADPGTGDTTPPTVSVTAPAAGATVSATTTVTATAADNVGVAGVQFLLDGANLGAEDTTAPYSVAWDTTHARQRLAHA